MKVSSIIKGLKDVGYLQISWTVQNFSMWKFLDEQ